MELERSKYQENMDRSRSQLLFLFAMIAIGLLLGIGLLIADGSDSGVKTLPLLVGFTATFIAVISVLMQTANWPGKYARIGNRVAFVYALYVVAVCAIAILN